MDLRDLITASAAQYGIDPATKLRIAELESSLNPAAANPNSSAEGLFQFIDSTWNQYGQGADRRDPAANADAAGRFLRDVSGSLRGALGREPEGWELYMGHQQGAGGARKLLSADPSMRAADLLGADAVRLNGGREDMTVGDFLGTWRNKFNGAAPTTSLRPVARPEGLGGLFGGEDAGIVPPMPSLRPVARPDRREAEAEQAAKRRQAFFGAGGLADTFS